MTDTDLHRLLNRTLDAPPGLRPSLAVRDGCPDFFRFADNPDLTWTENEETHVAACRHCQGRIAVIWRIECPPAADLERIGAGDSPYRTALREHLSRCSACRAQLGSGRGWKRVAAATMVLVVVAGASAALWTRRGNSSSLELLEELERQRSELEHQRALIEDLTHQQETLEAYLRFDLQGVRNLLDDHEERIERMLHEYELSASNLDP